jgi:hypothetical protein
MKIQERISFKYIYLSSLLAVYFLYVFALYGFIRGNYGPTFSPVTPDSPQYICRGLQFANLDADSVSRFMSQITVHFRGPSDADLSCGPVSLLYQSRFLLPFLISLFTVFGNFWVLFLPTLLLALGSIFLWWKLTNSDVARLGFLGIIVGIAPWLSPHFGGHVFLVMTEGPLIFLLLCILVSTKIRTHNTLYFFTLFIFSVLGTLNRQSWPIFATFLGFSIVTRFKITKKLRVFFVFFATMIWCFFQSALLTDSISESISFSKLPDIAYGIGMGLLGDIVHLFQLVDLPGMIVVLSMAIIFFKVRNLEYLFASALLLAVSLYAQGGIYLYDKTFSQNWRYYVPNAFFAVFSFLSYLQTRKRVIT